MQSIDMEPLMLTSERLTVEIAPPGGVYRGSRFDWTGFITQVTLDGRHTFCVPESMTPGMVTGGIGLCNEFGISEPVGYADARRGDKFPKIGIGLLQRGEETEYHFARTYPISPFPMTLTTSAGEAKFVVDPVNCRGYAVKLEKTIAAAGNRLRIAYQLQNVGSKPICTTEYCHNFIGIDGYTVGPDYRLRFPYRVKMDNDEPVLAKDGEIEWTWEIKRDFYRQIRGFDGLPDHRWELIHVPSGVGVREYDDFPACRVALWGRGHVVSPEAFIEIDLTTGESKRWSREYEFFAPDR